MSVLFHVSVPVHVSLPVHVSSQSTCQCPRVNVQMAIELFGKSTMEAAKMGAIELEGGTGDAERTCENLIRQRIHIGQTIPKKRLVEDILAQASYFLHDYDLLF